MGRLAFSVLPHLEDEVLRGALHCARTHFRPHGGFLMLLFRPHPLSSAPLARDRQPGPDSSSAIASLVPTRSKIWSTVAMSGSTAAAFRSRLSVSSVRSVAATAARMV
jgi:hypothetical protein